MLEVDVRPPVALLVTSATMVEDLRDGVIKVTLEGRRSLAAVISCT
jgi:hypothetical protein